MVPGNPHVLTAGRRGPRFDYSTGGRDADHNFGRNSAAGQRACKNQSDESRQSHSNLFLFLNREPSERYLTTTLFSV
jgi:hypothetical protein